MKKPIKVGDMVYVTNNREWGFQPMKVKYATRTSESGYASCIHPEFGGGGFNISNLVKVDDVSKSRLKLLKELATLDKRVNELKKKLFGEIE